MTKVVKRVRLDEVTLMRTVLALLIVFMHAFTCYQGGWAKPEGYIDIPFYKWIARGAFAFALEAFVFISGYLFGYQNITLMRWGGVLNKAKRLIVPSIIFSIPYFFIFYDYRGILDFFYNIINGCGHMWYLPMLFWCFVGVILLQKLKFSDNLILLLFLLVNLFWPYLLILQIGRTANYIFYFYLGYVIYKHSDSIKKRINLQSLVIGWLLFLVVFLLLRPIKESIIIGDQNLSIYRLLTDSVQGGCQLIYATLGTFTFYISMVYYTQRKQLGQFTVRLASCCFGIYLIHQFLLKILYYNTNFSSIVGPYWLPWLGFILVLPISFYLSTLLLKTKMGKFLIG